MSKNILDEAEKYTGSRTCPNCGYQFPFWEFFRKYIMSYGLSKWPCRSCREFMKCDSVKIQVFWLIGFLISGGVFGVLTSYFGFGLLSIIFLIPGFAIIFLTLYYVKFEKYY